MGMLPLVRMEIPIYCIAPISDVYLQVMAKVK